MRTPGMALFTRWWSDVTDVIFSSITDGTTVIDNSGRSTIYTAPLDYLIRLAYCDSLHLQQPSNRAFLLRCRFVSRASGRAPLLSRLALRRTEQADTAFLPRQATDNSLRQTHSFDPSKHNCSLDSVDATC